MNAVIAQQVLNKENIWFGNPIPDPNVEPI